MGKVYDTRLRSRNDSSNDDKATVKKLEISASKVVKPNPGWTFACLIALAIKNSKTGRLTVSAMYKYVWDEYRSLVSASPGWKTTLRSCLSHSKYFYKIEGSGQRLSWGKIISEWAIVPIFMDEISYKLSECSECMKESNVTSKPMEITEKEDSKEALRDIAMKVLNVKVREDLKVMIQTNLGKLSHADPGSKRVSFSRDTVANGKELSINSRECSENHYGSSPLDYKVIASDYGRSEPTQRKADESLEIRSISAVHSTSVHIKQETVESQQNMMNQYDVHSKPDWPYSCLAAYVLKLSKTGRMTTSEIYKAVADHFVYYRTSSSDSWKNSLRQALSSSGYFYKVEEINIGTRIATVYAMCPDKISEMDAKLSKCLNTSVSELSKIPTTPIEEEVVVDTEDTMTETFHDNANEKVYEDNDNIGAESNVETFPSIPWPPYDYSTPSEILSPVSFISSNDLHDYDTIREYHTMTPYVPSSSSPASPPVHSKPSNRYCNDLPYNLPYGSLRQVREYSDLTQL